MTGAPNREQLRKNSNTRRVGSLLAVIGMLLCTSNAVAANWAMLQTKDAMTDEPITATYEEHKEGLNDRTAVIRCQGKLLEIVFDFGEVMSGEVLIIVRYRFDKNAVVYRNDENRWLMTSKLTGVTPVSDAEAVDLMNQMANATTFVIEVFGDEDYRATFDLTGAASKIAQVRTACGK